ncbi:hypothetical protein FACS189429_5300 [Bacteroidia bacterium]|nr:hypothetical protein FACS189429_5300 [Bacteroidia bacterium]
MKKVTIEYNAQNAIFQYILEVALLSGARIVEEPQPAIKETERKQHAAIEGSDKALKLYQTMFGKRKDNKYSEKEIFLVNSKINAAKAFEKYL